MPGITTTGWTDNFEFAFAHKDAYDESDDTPERAKAGLLKGVGR